VLESFGHRYYTNNTDWVKSSEACYVLAFATVLLNVDLHNPKVSVRVLHIYKPSHTAQRLTCLREGKNENGTICSKFARPQRRRRLPWGHACRHLQVHRRARIKGFFFLPIKISRVTHPHQMQLLEDYTGGKMTQIKWNSVLRKSSKCSAFVLTGSNAYDKDIFSIILGCPIIAAISVGAYHFCLSWFCWCLMFFFYHCSLRHSYRWHHPTEGSWRIQSLRTNICPLYAQRCIW